MSLSPTFRSNRRKQATSDFAHHSQRRVRFKEEEARNAEIRFGDRQEFGRRQEVGPKRGLFARFRRAR